jgi:hypothetical protein
MNIQPSPGRHNIFKARYTHRLTIAFALVAAAIAPVSAQAPADAFSPKTIHDEIAYLASDALKGRDTGEQGNEMAARYIAAKFARDGLKPIGTSRERDAAAPMDKSGYFQPFTFLAGHKVGKNTTLELDYSGAGPFNILYNQGTRVLASAGKNYSVLYKEPDLLRPSGVSGEGKADGPVVFAGYGIHAPSLGHDDFASQDVRGKVILIIAGSPGDNPHEPLYAYGSLLRKASAAFDLGVRGILVFSPQDTEMKAERFEYQRNDDAGVPVLRISPRLAWTMFNGEEMKGLVAQADAGKSVTRTLSVTAHIEADVHKITKVTANIVGLIEGSDPVLKNEVVVIGGHMDHLGMGSPYSLAKSDAPAIHHGADDNASGAAGVMEMGHYFGPKGPGHVRTKRSILLICFTGEELGLYGSEYYVKHPILPLDNTVAMLNMDMVGRLRENKLIVIGSESSPSFSDLLTEVNRSAGLTIAKSGGDFGGGSDHESFENKQIPILFFFTGTHEDYHTPTDTVDKINSEGEAKVLRLVADCAEHVADSADRPVFHKNEKPTQPGGGFGVYFGSVPDYAAQVVGVQLNAVRAGSPAEKAGIKAGDIIVTFGERTIKNVYDYTYALQDHRPGDKVEVTVMRGSEKVTVTATLVSRAQ